MSASKKSQISGKSQNSKGFIPIIVSSTRQSLAFTRDITLGFTDIYDSSSKLTRLLNKPEYVSREELQEVLDGIFESLGRHPVMGPLRQLTSQMRDRHILPNEKTTENLMRLVLGRFTSLDSQLVPQQLTDEFWRLFNDLASEPEINGLGEISIDVVRVIVEAYQPLILKIINQLKDLRRTSDAQSQQLLKTARVIREDMVIFRRQVKALRHIRLFMETAPDDFHAQAKIIAEMVKEFGPFFIKFAQVAASNSDFLPDEISSALEVFHEDVEPMTPREVEQAFLESFGESPSRRYYDFDASKPLKSGSIASIYVAQRPLDPDSPKKILTPVVIKVGRHNLEREFMVGKTVIKLAILTSQYWAPHSKLSPFLKSWLEQTDIFVEGFTKELDFEREAATQARFAQRSVFSTGWQVPEIYSSTRRVLEMELVDNANSINKAFTHLNDRASRKARRKVARDYLHALLTHGLLHRELHGDLHHGNILVNSANKLYFIDWGNAIDLNEIWRPALQYLLSVCSGNTTDVVRSVEAMSVAPEQARAKSKEIAAAFEEAKTQYNLKPVKVRHAIDIFREGQKGIQNRFEMALNFTSALSRLGITINGSYLHLGRSISAMLGVYLGLYRGMSKFTMFSDAYRVAASFPAMTTVGFIAGANQKQSLKFPD